MRALAARAARRTRALSATSPALELGVEVPSSASLFNKRGGPNQAHSGGEGVIAKVGAGPETG